MMTLDAFVIVSIVSFCIGAIAGRLAPVDLED